MLQEIITYIIIGVAVIITVYKFVKRFSGTKKTKPEASNKAVSHVHNCGECAASGCELRDLPKRIIEKNIDDCVPVEKESKMFQS